MHRAASHAVMRRLLLMGITALVGLLALTATAPDAAQALAR